MTLWNVKNRSNYDKRLKLWAKDKDTEHLIGLLSSKSTDKRRMAASALRNRNDPRAVEPLIEALKDNDHILRSKAAISLGKLKDERAVQPLIKLIKNARDENDIYSASAALEDIGEPAVEPLIASLKEEDDGIRFYYSFTLGQMGRPALKPLLRSLNDSNKHVRRGAVIALAYIEDNEATRPLMIALKDADNEVRANTAFALGLIGDLVAKEALVDATLDPDPKVRKASKRALKILKNKQKGSKLWINIYRQSHDLYEKSLMATIFMSGIISFLIGGFGGATLGIPTNQYLDEQFGELFGNVLGYAIAGVLILAFVYILKWSHENSTVYHTWLSFFIFLNLLLFIFGIISGLGASISYLDGNWSI